MLLPNYTASSSLNQFDFDFALVTLSGSPGYSVGWMGVSDDCIEGQTYSVLTVGYPGRFLEGGWWFAGFQGLLGDHYRLPVLVCSGMFFQMPAAPAGCTKN